MIEFELSILDGIRNIMNTQMFEYIWVFFSHIGDLGGIWIAITISLLVFKKTRKVGIVCLISLIFGLIITNGILKNIIARPRPYMYTTVKLLRAKPREFSFPSGHTTAAFSLAFVLFKEKFKINNYRVYIPILVLASLVSFSRLYLYVHFPTDIIAGVAVGYLSSILARRLTKR